MKRIHLFDLPAVLGLAALSLGPAIVAAEGPARETFPPWALGPFVRPANAQPVIRPNPDAVFDCPMKKVPVHWEARHTFNPAAVIKDGRIHVLYRAEDDSSGGGIGRFTSRIGLAVSEDGVDFKRDPLPVLFPAEDGQKNREWPGGCEDPRLVEGPDGTFYMLYTQYARPKIRLGLATSKDLRTWTKHGSPFSGTRYEDNVGVQYKSATIVQEVKDGRPVAVKINGKYWMYFGESSVNLATSEDLIHWRPVEDKGGHPVTVMRPRHDCFDSGGLTEVGPLALLTSHGIVLFYNGKHTGAGPGKEIGLAPRAYAGGQALFDAGDPSRLIERLALPFIHPELPWEKTGQYASGTTFIEGLVLFRGRWFLYYGCADTFVGVAICDPAPDRPDKAVQGSVKPDPKEATLLQRRIPVAQTAQLPASSPGPCCPAGGPRTAPREGGPNRSRRAVHGDTVVILPAT